MIRIFRTGTERGFETVRIQEEPLYVAEGAKQLILELEGRVPLGALSPSEHVALLLILKNRHSWAEDVDVVLAAHGAAYRAFRRGASPGRDVATPLDP